MAEQGSERAEHEEMVLAREDGSQRVARAKQRQQQHHREQHREQEEQEILHQVQLPAIDEGDDGEEGDDEAECHGVPCDSNSRSSQSDATNVPTASTPDQSALQGAHRGRLIGKLFRSHFKRKEHKKERKKERKNGKRDRKKKRDEKKSQKERGQHREQQLQEGHCKDDSVLLDATNEMDAAAPHTTAMKSSSDNGSGDCSTSSTAATAAKGEGKHGKVRRQPVFKNASDLETARRSSQGSTSSASSRASSAHASRRTSALLPAGIRTLDDVILEAEEEQEQDQYNVFHDLVVDVSVASRA